MNESSSPAPEALLVDLVDGICLELGMTSDRLGQAVGNPQFGRPGAAPSAWQRYVPSEIVAAWAALPPEAVLVVYYMAQLRAREEVLHAESRLHDRPE